VGRIVAVLLAAASACAGWYLGAFAFRLAAQLTFYVVTMSTILLHLFGLEPTGELAAILALLRLNEGAMLIAAWAGTVAALVLAGAVGAMAGARRAAQAAAAVLVVATVAGAADLWYGITPFVDRLIPHTSLAAAERSVTCRLTVADIAVIHYKNDGCIAEVEGLLTYSERARTFELRPPDGARTPSARVSFYRGRRTHFSELVSTRQPRFYDQVIGFSGKHVRIIGQIYQGHLSADVGHIALAQTPPGR
jgi:hypothetical protein